MRKAIASIKKLWISITTNINIEKPILLMVFKFQNCHVLSQYSDYVYKQFS